MLGIFKISMVRTSEHKVAPYCPSTIKINENKIANVELIKNTLSLQSQILVNKTTKNSTKENPAITRFRERYLSRITVK